MHWGAGMFITMADTACGALLANADDMTLYGPQAGTHPTPCLARTFEAACLV